MYWVTDSKKIQKYIISKDYRYLTRKKPLQLVWKSLRAKIVIDSGTSYLYPFLFSSKTIKITTLHGNGPKATLSTHETLNKNLEHILKINEFDYVNFTSKYSAAMIGQRTYRLPPKKTIVLGYPRCDHYFDKDYVNKIYQKKRNY